MKLAIIAEYDPGFEPHVQTDAAIAHSASALKLDVEFEWLSTADERIEDLTTFDALWFAPGSPYRDMNRTVNAIRYAREQKVPTFGTCGGFQHMVIEFARNIVGISDAQHAEYDPYASRLIVSQLACSLVGREMQISLKASSMTAIAYGTYSVCERYYCNFGVNPEFVDQLSSAGFVVVGTDSDNECRVMEIPQHPFFVGTLYVPQARSLPDRPHPLINAFLLAAQR
ncbi:CTP synthase C-terminal region-related (seleno)protein [Neorhodopirellula lusitana]|uniref:CTP synthase C-terminal region-related (seleno)protein n=1 Tax=Neorhodopirellula lusitana TaxID=445327 RepID=UPI00384A6414